MSGYKRFYGFKNDQVIELGSSSRSQMKSNDTSLTTKSTGEAKAIIHCVVSPHFAWNPDDIVTRWCTVSINSVAFIPTILLNLLIIIAVNRRKTLQSNCNILLSSLAAADLFVGAVSQPLYVISHGFLRVVGSAKEQFCTVIFTYELVVYVASASSLYHLTVIAWERYTAIEKPYQYKTIVTRGLLKRLLTFIWIAPLLSLSPELLGLFFFQFNLEIRLFLLMFLNAPLCIVFPLIAYYYVGINIKVRNRPVIPSNQVIAITRAELEKKLAKNTGLITAAVILCYSPCFFLVFGLFWPALMDSSYFLWPLTLAHLNSILNPLLYCYRNANLRIAVLELLRIRDPPVVQPAAGGGRNTAWQTHPELVASVCESASRLGKNPRWNSCSEMANAIHPTEGTPENQRPQSAPIYLESNASSDDEKFLSGSINPKVSFVRATCSVLNSGWGRLYSVSVGVMYSQSIGSVCVKSKYNRYTYHRFSIIWR